MNDVAAASGNPRLCVVIPVFNDWESCAELVRRLAAVAAPLGWTLVLVVVDDGSLDEGGAELAGQCEVRVLRLARNLGHQKAIAIGLDHAVTKVGSALIAVMDADGEDRPEDLPALVAAHRGSPGAMVVARRGKRSEGTRFSIGYRVYKVLFRLLTGEHVDFGNFCVLGPQAARRLTAMQELWLNLPATAVRSRLPIIRVPIDRGVRYAGRSKMSLVALTTHGLSAVGVFSERAFTRLLLLAGAAITGVALGLVVALGLKLAGLATPGWVTGIAETLVVLTVQSAAVALCGLFVVFGSSDVMRAPHATAPTLIERIDFFAPSGYEGSVVHPARA